MDQLIKWLRCVATFIHCMKPIFVLLFISMNTGVFVRLRQNIEFVRERIAIRLLNRSLIENESNTSNNEVFMHFHCTKMINLLNMLSSII